MEEDKKKKKNRKKKKNQANKPIGSVPVDAGESTSASQSHILDIEQNNDGQVSVIIDEPNNVGQHIHADRKGHLTNDTEGKNLVEAEKQYLPDKEASLEERIQQLLKEKDENSQKEATQKDKIKQLHDENNAFMQNEDGLKEKLVRLEKENDAFIQKEGGLEQKIQQLQREMDAKLQKEASLEMEILQLKDENVSRVWKEVSLEEKIKQIERERDTLILKENSAEVSIASLTNDNTNLRAQVIELKESRESLLRKIQELKEIISSLQLQINNLASSIGLSHSSMDNKVASENGDANYQIEDARAVVGKLIAENSKLVEKVNELYAELDQKGVKQEHFSSAELAQSTDIADGSALIHDLTVGTNDKHSTAPATDSVSKASKIMPISDSTQSLEDVMIKDHMNGELVNVNDGPGLANSSEIIEADEIVQIPLDENEIEEPDLQVAEDDEKDDISITDAPLIGAPFRLISFVARYVSGADLVNKNSGKNGY